MVDYDLFKKIFFRLTRKKMFLHKNKWCTDLCLNERNKLTDLFTEEEPF